VLDRRGATLFDALQAFFQAHQYCGDLDGGVEGDRVQMTCSCGEVLVRVVVFGETPASRPTPRRNTAVLTDR
jgi:hypothetical protein